MDKLQEDEQESVVMPTSNGGLYMCYLPKLEKAKSGKPITQHNISSMVVESVKRIKLKTPDELLEELEDQCFVRVSTPWICSAHFDKIYVKRKHNTSLASCSFYQKKTKSKENEHFLFLAVMLYTVGLLSVLSYTNYCKFLYAARGLVVI